MENPITLTITPSNQEDFLNSLARKVIERGIDDEIILNAVESVKDNIDYDDIRESALEDLDVRDIRQEVIDDIDYTDMASSVLEEIDMYDLASDIYQHMDTESVIDALDIESEVNNMVRESISDEISRFGQSIDTLTNLIHDLDTALANANVKIAALERNANRSFFSRIFGR